MLMRHENNLLDIKSFNLKSSGEINKVLNEIDLIQTGKMLIHIVSYLHNTVLVQNLHKELTKKYDDAKIVLLQHQDKNNTVVTVFGANKNTNLETISDEVLKELHSDIDTKNEKIQKYRNQLFYRYFNDNLTNLPNLYQLRKDLQDNESLGLLLIKIDNFQIINNFYGFVVGDYVIEDVGKSLKSFFQNNCVYRLSGSEFAVTLEESLGFYDLKDYLEKLYANIKGMVVVYQDMSISIEFTLSSIADRSIDDLFSKASMAMKFAQDNRLPYWIYENRMNFENEYERNLKLSEVVRESIEDSRVIPYYQAIVDTKTFKIVKYECLARLVDKQEKIISPLIFIPIAKKIKMYNNVTKLIIEKSFKTFENSDLEFNINLSIEDIMSSSIFNFIINKLKTSKASNRVTFELLESEAVQDFTKVERFINEVKRYGAKLAIDDFGSGFSNFSYLIQMKTDYIKIDGSLIKNIDVDKQSLLVVETIVEFAKKLGVKTVAEYVHTSVVLEKVQELGIDYAQGFYIDEPSIKL